MQVGGGARGLIRDSGILGLRIYTFLEIDGGIFQEIGNEWVEKKFPGRRLEEDKKFKNDPIGRTGIRSGWN